MSEYKIVIDSLIQEHLARLISVITDGVPSGDNPNTIDAWLTSIPNEGNIRRDKGRPSSDLKLIINDLDKLPLGDDHWALELFIGNIIHEHKSYPIAEKMHALLEMYIILKKKQSDIMGDILIERVDQKLQLQTRVDDNKKLALKNLLEPYNFDLRILARECVNNILKKRGLVGFGIPYDSYPFLINFCERIKIDLGRKNIHPVRTPLDLKPYVMSVDRAISRIMGYKDLLETGDVICPVQAPPFDYDIIDNFWERIKANFENGLKNCFIVILVGNPNYNFPEGVIQLKAPQLEIVDLHEWVRDIGGILDLPDFVIDIWRTEMERQCRNEDSLELEEAYHHINMAKDLLNNYPEYEDFISNFLKRSMNLEGIS